MFTIGRELEVETDFADRCDLTSVRTDERERLIDTDRSHSFIPVCFVGDVVLHVERIARIEAECGTNDARKAPCDRERLFIHLMMDALRENRDDSRLLCANDHRIEVVCVRGMVEMDMDIDIHVSRATLRCFYSL